MPLINGTNARVTITTTASTSGVATNVANVAAFEADFSPANNSSTLLTTINPLADLSLGMTASTNSVYAGSNVVYTIFITNQGPSTASGVVLTNPLPAGATLVSATTTLGVTNLSSGIVSFNLGTMASNAIATAVVTLKLSASGTITNIASITYAGADPDPSDNTASVSTAVSAAADLAVSQSVSLGSVLVSSNVTFTIVVTNKGPSTANNVVLTESLPTALSLVSAQWNGSWSQANGLLTFNTATLASGASSTAIVVVRPTIDGVFGSSVGVSSGVADLVPGNNTANSSVTVTDNPAMPLLKISRSSTNVVLSWSTNAQSFVLQFAPDLSPGAQWTDMTNTPVRVGNQWTVTDSVLGDGRFYRLHRSLANLSATFVSPNKIVVSWPVTAPGAVLKTSTNSGSSGVWVVISNPPPVVVGDRYYVTNPVSGPNHFYRLYN